MKSMCFQKLMVVVRGQEEMTTVVLDLVIEAVTRQSITHGLDAKKTFIDNLKKGVPAIVPGTLNTAADID